MILKKVKHGLWTVKKDGITTEFGSRKEAVAFKNAGGIVDSKPAAKPAKKEETILEDLKDGVPKAATIEKIKDLLEDKE